MNEKPGDPAPFFERHVFMCVNERAEDHPRGCCKARGGEDLRGYMKAKAKAMGIKDIRINQSGCLDRCELGPMMVIYPEGVWYKARTFEDIDEVLESHLVGGDRVERLMVKPGDDPPKPQKPAAKQSA